MEANKTPEKIYLNPLLMEDGESVVRRCTFERLRDSQIEYTRTDTIIEKACKAYCKTCKMPNCYSSNSSKCTFINNFREHMKGE